MPKIVAVVKFVPVFIISALALLICSCCQLPLNTIADPPPILAQDEIVRPYQKVGLIDLKCQRYFNPDDLSASDFKWGYQALREEAGRIGADAVIFPEVKLQQQQFLFFPFTEMSAKGVAIKFK